MIETNPQTKPDYPQFTPEMKKTHTLLVPQMAPLHFAMICDAIEEEGYKVAVLQNTSGNVIREGLQYVHNDMCYPALLVIGQFIDALKHGGHDPDHTALIITQTGGGCRASNYIHLLRKALMKAGYPQVPVASINFSNLLASGGLKLTPRLIIRVLAACYYGDALMSLQNQVRPYEVKAGQAEALVSQWQRKIGGQFREKRGTSKADMQRNIRQMAADFAAIPMERKPKYKVGIVGEIYVKYSPMGNNNLEDFLVAQGCEVCVPGLMGFIQYCIANFDITTELYGGNPAARKLMDAVLNFTIKRENILREAIGNQAPFYAPGSFEKVRELAKGFIGMGTKMGEGWLLTGEMAELIESGFPNIVCAQPFGCLPNHVVGRGMIAGLRAAYPDANITSIDYDPSATRVNQENRIKLMLATAEKTE